MTRVSESFANSPLSIRMLQWQWIVLNKEEFWPLLWYLSKVLFLPLWPYQMTERTLCLLKNKQTALPQTLTPWLLSKHPWLQGFISKEHLAGIWSHDVGGLSYSLGPRTLVPASRPAGMLSGKHWKGRARSSEEESKDLVREQFDLRASMIGI